MDLDGVYATLCFPSLIAGFAGTIFASSKDPELGLACLRAWNDWHAEEWAGPHPDRVIPLQLAWLHDPRDRGRRRSPQRRARLQGRELPREPRRPEAPVDAHRPLGPVPPRVRRDANRHLPAQRIVVVDRGPVAGRAARAVHVVVLGERDGRGGRLALGAHPDRASPRSASRSPRAASAGCRC